MSGESPLSDRDQAAIRLVAKFGQMTARQIGDLLFADLASLTPLHRCLRRLTDRGYLSRLELRLVGGPTAGSSQFVYQLGRAGQRLLGLPGRYWAYRSVNHHAIELADVYVTLKALERGDDIKVLRFDVEREAWREMGGVQLTPDAYLELGYPTRQIKVAHFIELDRGTEGANRLKEKCVRYWQAYQRSDELVFPWVLFVVPDDARRHDIDTLITNRTTNGREVFSVCTRTQIKHHLVSLQSPGTPPAGDQHTVGMLAVDVLHADRNADM